MPPWMRADRKRFVWWLEQHLAIRNISHDTPKMYGRILLLFRLATCLRNANKLNKCWRLWLGEMKEKTDYELDVRDWSSGTAMAGQICFFHSISLSQFAGIVELNPENTNWIEFHHQTQRSAGRRQRCSVRKHISNLGWASELNSNRIQFDFCISQIYFRSNPFQERLWVEPILYPQCIILWFSISLSAIESFTWLWKQRRKRCATPSNNNDDTNGSIAAGAWNTCNALCVNKYTQRSHT